MHPKPFHTTSRYGQAAPLLRLHRTRGAPSDRTPVGTDVWKQSESQFCAPPPADRFVGVAQGRGSGPVSQSGIPTLAVLHAWPLTRSIVDPGDMGSPFRSMAIGRGLPPVPVPHVSGPLLPLSFEEGWLEVERPTAWLDELPLEAKDTPPVQPEQLRRAASLEESSSRSPPRSSWAAGGGASASLATSLAAQQQQQQLRRQQQLPLPLPPPAQQPLADGELRATLLLRYRQLQLLREAQLRSAAAAMLPDYAAPLPQDAAPPPEEAASLCGASPLRREGQSSMPLPSPAPDPAAAAGPGQLAMQQPRQQQQWPPQEHSGSAQQAFAPSPAEVQAAITVLQAAASAAAAAAGPPGSEGSGEAEPAAAEEAGRTARQVRYRPGLSCGKVWRALARLLSCALLSAARRSKGA